jgi:hypothetical protein
MKQNKMISLEPHLIEQVIQETDNFSEACGDALEEWLVARRESGLSENAKLERINKLEKRLKDLKEVFVDAARQEEIKEWLKAQTPEFRGGIYELAANEHRNYEDIAREFKAGTRKALP